MKAAKNGARGRKNRRLLPDRPELRFTELCAQPYRDCRFSAGTLKGHPADNLYLCFERDGGEPTMFFLRPDEMAAIAWVATGVLWSDALAKLPGEAAS